MAAQTLRLKTFNNDDCPGLQFAGHGVYPESLQLFHRGVLVLGSTEEALHSVRRPKQLLSQFDHLSCNRVSR